MVSTTISPSAGKKLDTLTTSTTANGGTITVDVLRASDNAVLASSVSSGYNLSGITVPIKLRANLSRTTATANPVLNSWTVTEKDFFKDYAFLAGATASGRFTITLNTLDSNITPTVSFNVQNDNVGPVITITDLPSPLPLVYDLNWNVTETGAGVQNYDIRILPLSETSCDAATPVLAFTSPDNRVIIPSDGVNGEQICVRGTDRVGNVGSWAVAQQTGFPTDNGHVAETTSYFSFASQPVVMVKDGSTYYLGSDQLGSVSLVTKPDGTVVSEIATSHLVRFGKLVEWRLPIRGILVSGTRNLA